MHSTISNQTFSRLAYLFTLNNCGSNQEETSKSLQVNLQLFPLLLT